MPNHIHGILIIDKPNIIGNADVETQNIASLPPMSNTKNKFGPQSQNLGSVIRSFKIAVTYKAKQIQPDFKWQGRYHDHIIKNESTFQRIRDYIKTNPLNWEKDKFY